MLSVHYRFFILGNIISITVTVLVTAPNFTKIISKMIGKINSRMV